MKAFSFFLSFFHCFSRIANKDAFASFQHKENFKGKSKETLFIHSNNLKLSACGAVWDKFFGGFWGEGKTGVPREKALGGRKRTNNKLNPHETLDRRIEPGPH